GNTALEHTAPTVPSSGQVPAWITVLPDRESQSRHWHESRPGNRGFRFAMPGAPEWPFDASGAAASVVASRLATDGLARTTARVAETLGIDIAKGFESAASKLQAAGLPTDLLSLASGHLAPHEQPLRATPENCGAEIGTFRVQLTGP